MGKGILSPNSALEVGQFDSWLAPLGGNLNKPIFKVQMLAGNILNFRIDRHSSETLS